ncbi:hypothetical protein [Nocardia vinacea]|uniref:hypothetical protein n=1 Tax=Nocardia vinacea TaxID=96468 RepID=UPI0002D758D8|nr:hypothetical protein [Nocardia vinacea]
MTSTDDPLGHILDAIDISPWRDVPPETLAASPGLLAGHGRSESAGRSLKYARASGARRYDEIGFRWLAAAVAKGHVPLQTFAQARLDAQREPLRKLTPRTSRLLEQAPKLRHRPLAFPDGHLQWTLDSDLLNATIASEDGGDGIVWSYPLSAPPEVFVGWAADEDVPPLVTQYRPSNVPATSWLPLLVLIGRGRFERMQDCRDELTTQLCPGHYYCFLSHRWLTPTAPDPDGTQARLAAWQLVAAMCEAIYVAERRGLHTPRKVLRNSNTAVGPAGSELAESLVVNVLRQTLDEAGLAEVHAEISDLERITADNGVAAAHADVGFTVVRDLVAGRPLLAVLLARMHLWYDFSCLPQEPRTLAERAEFEQGIRLTGLLQLLGRTAILLDDADDYLTRAWCTLEALTAGIANYDVLVGADRPTVTNGSTEHHLTMLLQDRPDIVWRALLDTEIFGVQTPLECLRRLDVTATDPADLPVIYTGLCGLGAPTRIHYDGSQIVTGTFPLPVVRSDTVLIPADSAMRLDRPPAAATATLSWMDALRLGRERPAWIVSYQRFYSTGCHVVVVGSCEAEAVLFSGWVLAHADELERTIGTHVGSLSWLAADVAPVGHFAEGVLRTVAIEAALWVVISLRGRFDVCSGTKAVVNVIAAAGTPFATVALDLPANNLTWYQPTETSGDAVRIAARHARVGRWPGGLFAGHLLAEMRDAVAGRSS